MKLNNKYESFRVLAIVHTLITILSRFGFQFQKYHHASGTFHCNVIKKLAKLQVRVELETWGLSHLIGDNHK